MSDFDARFRKSFEMPLCWPAQIDCGISRSASGARPEAKPLAGVQGRQPLPSWLSGASGPRESSERKGTGRQEGKGCEKRSDESPLHPQSVAGQQLMR